MNENVTVDERYKPKPSPENQSIYKLLYILTEIGGIVVGRTVQAERGEMVDETGDGAPVDAVALGQGVQRVEHLELEGARLVDRADYRAVLHARQPLQQGYALAARGRVQTWNFTCFSLFFFYFFMKYCR